MSRIGYCHRVLLGFGLGLGFIGGPAAAQTGDIMSRMRACRVIGDMATRAACYDRLTDSLTPLQPNPSPSALSRAAPTPPLPPVTASPPPAAAPNAPAINRFGQSDLPIQKVIPKEELPPDEMIARVKSVRGDAAGNLTVTLDNGQVWRQTEAGPLRILPGSAVKIRSGVLGAFYMSLVSANRSVRVKRIN
ncbi:MAG: hypothetical protein EXR11_00015 [Rhodospirillaceae bacterium]|nr:hypothetical protein [Rhodospirillaceae bacterium]